MGSVVQSARSVEPSLRADLVIAIYVAVKTSLGLV